MIQLKLRSEYSFKLAYGQLNEVLACVTGSVAGLTDRGGTWGHVPWSKACKAKGITPIYGAELAFCPDHKAKDPRIAHLSLLARNNDGLDKLYKLVSKATAQAGKEPLLEYDELHDLGDEIIVLSGFAPDWGLLPSQDNIFVELGPRSSPKAIEVAKKRKFGILPVSDNHFPRPENKAQYEVLAGRWRDDRPSPMHILSEDEWRYAVSNFADKKIQDRALQELKEISTRFKIQLPQAQLPRFEVTKTLEQLCKEGAKQRKVNIHNSVYQQRLKRELNLIYAKGFEDYFYIVEDLIRFAKTKMLVGPARGSSCGSLVCYLLGITEIDPIPFGLLFERFIDINRMDLPDIDIDFQDTKREEVFEYLRQKYGEVCVARLGTVARLKTRSAIEVTAQAFNIPPYETSDFKNAISEETLRDAFTTLDAGQKLAEKHPGMVVAADLENHASHTSQHAAGVVVTSEPVMGYCSVDLRNGVAMVDKKDCESLNLLKIDCLGLRTLSVVQDCLDQVGMTRDDLLKLPLEDQEAFNILNREQYSGIFQFEGFAIQGLCRLMRVEKFEDIVSLTAIARPGPLDSGGAHEFIKRRTGRSEVSYLHKAMAEATSVTFGIVVYQEQVMQILRGMGNLSWEDTSTLRKAMSKSLGAEAFEKFWPMFLDGAKSHGATEEEAKRVWDYLATMGYYSFNRSHAVAYALVSYWCMWLKSRYPLEFAAAVLRNAKDNESAIQLLRELKINGHKIKVYDPSCSQENWSVQGETLVGGLLNVAGIGPSKAQDIMNRRKLGLPLTTGQQKLLDNGKTPFDTIFEGAERFGHILKDPRAYNIFTKVFSIAELTGEDSLEAVVLAKIKEKVIRDHNEPKSLARRNGRKMSGKTLYLQLQIEDDTGTITAVIERNRFEEHGKPLYESAVPGDWFVFKGRIQAGFRRFYIDKHRSLALPQYARPE